jgi:hypothetical protein
MKTLIFGSATFAAGVLFAIAWRPTSVNAQDVRPAAAVRIEEVPVNGDQVKALRGSPVKGFSCATDGSGRVHCYVITGS